MSRRGPTIIGRDAERRALVEAFEDARAGSGHTLVFIGEPGAGKTTLLRHAESQWENATVLRCIGVEWEAELPFAGLHALVSPLLDDLDSLPLPQRRAVLTALGIEAGMTESRLHLFAGVLSLILERTRTEPVLLLCDDLQWLDEPTRQVLAFVAPRIIDESVALIGASRTPPTPIWSRAHVVVLEPLTADEVGELAAGWFGGPLPAHAVIDLAKAAHGNPLAVKQAVSQLGDGLTRRGTWFQGPLNVGHVAEPAFVDQLRALTPSAARAIELLAVSYTHEASAVNAALAQLDLGAEHLEEAELAGVVEFRDGQVRFVHPLLRSLVYQRAAALDLRQCHRALSTVEHLDADVRAWHQACATVGVDERTAHALEVSARRFLRRGGALAAAQALKRAAELSESRASRSDRLHDAAVAAHSAGHSQWGVELAGEAVSAADDVVRRTRAAYREMGMRLQSETVGGLTARVQLELAEQVRGLDPQLEADILGSVVIEATMTSDRLAHERAIEAIGAIDLDALSTADYEDLICARATGILYFGSAGSAEASDQLVHSAQRRLDLELTREGFVIEGLMWIERYDLAEQLGLRALKRATQDADLLSAVPVAAALGLVSYTTGAWDAARRHWDLAASMADAGDHASNRATVTLMRGLLGAGQGDRAVVDEAIHIVELAEGYGFSYAGVFAHSGAGLLALGEQRYADAVEALGRVQRDWKGRAIADPNPLSWSLDRVEAHLLSGDREGAADALDDLRQIATSSRRSWHTAAIPLAEGMLGGDAVFEASLRHSIEVFDSAHAPFERARAQLWLGRRLRAVGRLADAGPPLQAALAEFERLSAEPWIAQTRRELGRRASPTPRRRRRAGDDPDVLTAQERQVAELVARGATNKEAAGELFLSPKTVESHLSRIYRKLGVSSRTQLAARWQELDAASREG